MEEEDGLEKNGNGGRKKKKGGKAQKIRITEDDLELTLSHREERKKEGRKEGKDERRRTAFREV